MDILLSGKLRFYTVSNKSAKNQTRKNHQNPLECLGEGNFKDNGQKINKPPLCRRKYITGKTGLKLNYYIIILLKE